jgi:hypothetical protein
LDNLLDVILPMEENTSLFNKAIKTLIEKIKTVYAFEISKEELEKIIESCKASTNSDEKFRECVKKKVNKKRLDNKKKIIVPKGDKPKGDKPKGDKPKCDKPKGDKPKGNKPK